MSDTLFARRELRASFVFRTTGSDGTTSDNTLTVRGLRMACQIVGAGLIAGVMCSLRIEGMTLDQMNTLSKLQTTVIGQGLNTVTVEARSGGSGAWRTVFDGSVIEAFADFAGSPNTAFMVSAMTMGTVNMRPVPAISFPGDVAIADIMKAIASNAGLGFQNNGVTGALKGGVTYNGTAGEQMEAVAAATHITYSVGPNRILKIWPEHPSADSVPAIEISADTGMMGYPGYSQYGINVATLFNGGIEFQSVIRLNSQYAPAAWTKTTGQYAAPPPGAGGGSVQPPYNGLWVVLRVQHDLQSETPDGQWTTYIEAARPQVAQGTVNAH